MSEFLKAIPIILEHEGDWVDDPADRGGETRFGISLKMIVSTLGIKPADLGLLDFNPGCMKLLTKGKACEIYRKYFWDKHNLDAVIDQNAATKIFDATVNMGSRWGVKCAQRACEADDDGILGSKTLAAINKMGPGFEDAMALTMKKRYEDIIARNPSQVKFQRTWFFRAGCVSTARCICHPHG